MDGKPYDIYIPYESSSKSESGSSVGSDESLENVGGPNFADFARKLTYEKQDLYGPYEPLAAGPETKPEPPKTKDITSLFLIDSKNRDTNAFPQPTSFTLQPPRVYKNVTSIQVTQIKLLSSFFYFRNDKENTVLPLVEIGRIEINSYLGHFLTAAIQIREGTYSINDLLAELQTQMNVTPVFYDFPGGFTDFITNFTINGDLSINFNQPGDTYYDRLNSKYIQNPTIASIVAYYWGSRYAGLLQYTIDQVKVAYYYPVLYEAILNTTESRTYPLLNLSNVPDGLINSGETVYSRIVFNSTGLNDPAILFIINQNIPVLDTYRLLNTFRYYPINRYQLSYDTNNLRVNIVTLSLNTSLVNLINNVNAVNLANVLDLLSITNTDYTNLNNTLNRARVVYSDMYNFMQSQLTKYFAIPFATYASQYFNVISNTLYIQNGLIASGVRASYTPEYLTSGVKPISSITTLSKNSPNYWPNLTPIFDYSQVNPAESMVPYSVTNKNFQFGLSTIDASGYFINTNKATRSVDILVTINPAQYTVLKFRSRVRQTLQVETLPLPYYYRFADYNSQGLYKGVLDLNKGNVLQKHFDISYSYLYNDANSMMDNSNYSTIVLANTFGQTFATMFSSAPVIPMNSQSSYLQFEFTSPYPSSITNGLVKYNTKLAFIAMNTSNVSTMFSDKFDAYLYHDRAAFMADLEFQRDENPLHYIQSAKVNTSNSDLTFNISTFAGHTYYAIFRSDALSFSNILFTPVVYYTDTSYTQIQTDYTNFDPAANPYDASNVSNYPFVVNYDTDFIRLPVASSLQGLDPSSSTFQLALLTDGTPIGYDKSGVSDDLTDYIGFSSDLNVVVPNTRYRTDPFSKYVFQSITPYNTASKTYFGSNSLNSLLVPVTNNPYAFKGTSSIQLKIVHWYDGYTIPRQTDDAFTTFNTISIAPRNSINSALAGFPVNSNGNVKFGRGINAIGFLPTDGVYDVSSFVFKSSIYPKSGSTIPSEDPNSQIQYIGVFSGAYLAANIINLNAALTVLSFNKAYVYNSDTASNTPGFGTDLGTWYEYVYNPSFVSSSNVNINGYTPNSNDLLSYDSMYYMVPFNASMSNVTFSQLDGSLLPYPLYQTISTGSTYFGFTAANPVGAQTQAVYIMPSTISSANPAYGPASGISQTQSQYELSMPITTTSIGYKDYGYLVTNSNTPFAFNTIFSNAATKIQTSQIGITTYFTEYSDSLYLVNSQSNYNVISNVDHSFAGAAYASSISTVIGTNPAQLSSIKYLLSVPSTIQNFSTQGNVNSYSTFTFKEMAGYDSNITTQSFVMDPSMGTIHLWLWGGGGSTWTNSNQVSGGAGAHATVSIDVSTLIGTSTSDCPGGVSTLYFVVGKGGNRDNVAYARTTGVFDGYEQPRYGGGGTSILDTSYGVDNIYLQGGGFTGIFTGSNLLTATPLLIVGGGGAAGSYDFGGPGGIGLMPSSLPSTFHAINAITTTATAFGIVQFTGALDLDSNAVIGGSNISYATDSNLLTYWQPTATPYMNPANYNHTPNTYRSMLNYTYNGTNSLLKLRYYGSAIDDVVHMPTGFVVYNDINKSQILFSNTSIQPSDFQVVQTGLFKQAMYEMPLSQVSAVPFQKNAWIVGGSNTTNTNAIQYSLDGSNWVPVTTNSYTNQEVKSVQYVSAFNSWYACGTNSILRSTNGLDWLASSAPANSYASLAFGLVGTTNTLVALTLSGAFIVTTDGNTWTTADVTGNFSSLGTRVRFINNMFWALGGTSVEVKSSVDGLVWTSVSVGTTSGVYDIAYGLGLYVLVQNNTVAPYFSGIITSLNGITWNAVTSASIAGFSANSVVFGNGTFVASGIVTPSGASCLKYSTNGSDWYNSSFVNIDDIGRYEVQYIGGKFVCVGRVVNGSQKAPNQMSIITSINGINWSYSLTGGYSGAAHANAIGYGSITITPNMSNVYVEIQKLTNISYPPLVNEIRGYNTSTVMTTGITNMIDNDMTTMYSGSNDVIDYPFTFTFLPSTVVNKFQVVCPQDSIFTGITVQGLYSNLNIQPGSFSLDSALAQSMYELRFASTMLSTISVILKKNTVGPLKINEIKAFDDPNQSFSQYTAVNGYFGDASGNMAQMRVAISPYDGGGGTLLNGGVAGSNGYNGEYLIGGSPAKSGNYDTATSFTQIQYGAGGGGGGYYGGGGGGSQSNLGGAGGGGAGYIYTPVISTITLTTAIPNMNFLTPSLAEQQGLLYSNILPSGSMKYGQGGQSGIDNGTGSHGIIVLGYESSATINSPNNSTATPAFIDGSKLSLFQAPITYNTDARVLNFNTFLDPIQSSQYAGYNWVWYSSYLSLVGCSLLSTMTASSSVVQAYPPTTYNTIPVSVYNKLVSQFANVSSLYGTPINSNFTSTCVGITSNIQAAFTDYQSQFVQISYASAVYEQATQIYCLLDYLSQLPNIANPHVNPMSSSLDRIFGGLPGFGYWANPFLTNVSYIGFDVGPSLYAPSNLSIIAGNSNPVRAFYGLVLEQSLITGQYTMKDIMAYKPSPSDISANGAGWSKVSQFNDSYYVRDLTHSHYLRNQIPTQPYSIRNGINARIPLFQYRVYTTPLLVGSNTVNSPIHMINDFEGSAAYFYSFQNVDTNNVSTIQLNVQACSSTMININQSIVTKQANTPTSIMGGLVVDASGGSVLQTITQFGYNQTNTTNFTPVITYSSGSGDFYNTYASDSPIQCSNLGAAITDSYANIYVTNTNPSASNVLYENICTSKVFYQPLSNVNINYTNPVSVLSEYNLGNSSPYYDFLFSKNTNIWHLQGSSNLSTIYGVRLSSPYDFNITTSFANQVFYPTHKIILTKKGAGANPITNTTDLANYPSYSHTEMFFYKDRASTMKDISGKYAAEKTTNFANSDMSSGYFFDSYINNINLAKSTNLDDADPDSFYYLAIRGYSPSESFKTLLRFYLPGRYDFGYISLADLSGEVSLIQTTTADINPDYATVLNRFHTAFSTTRTYGSTGQPGFSGSNLSSINFGDFLTQYNHINSTINATSYITSTVNGFLAQGQSTLVNGDLKYIVPSYLANRQRITDPLEFRLPFSTVVSTSNAGVQEYGLGYNLGYLPIDTDFNTIHRADSFFKILDDYIYLRMNPEYNMNRLDVSSKENFAETRDTTAQGQLYNCRLILNNFGTYATTFVQNPVSFNPPIGKLDKLSFYWYDVTGTLINNVECEWSGAIQVVEKVESST